MDNRLLQIAAKSAGQYFIVTDNSFVADVEIPSNLRVFVVNLPNGPVNNLVYFKQGDTKSFASVFGKGTRQQEKRGNYSVASCLKGLQAGPIAVLNLRVFNEQDVVGIAGLNPNDKEVTLVKPTTNYTNLFNTNSIWTPKAKNLVNYVENALLNFGNIGTGALSIFVVKAASEDVDLITNEGNNSIRNSSIEVDDFESLNMETLIKNTFVSVYIFNNVFNDPNISTNPYYGQLFDGDGLVNLDNLDKLSKIPESGFARKITGTLLPNVKNEYDDNISIDTLINNVYAETGLLSYLNIDLLDLAGFDLNLTGKGYYDPETGDTLEAEASMLSHRYQSSDEAKLSVDLSLIKATDLTNLDQFKAPDRLFIEYKNGIQTARNKVKNIAAHQIRVGDIVTYVDSSDDSITDVEVISIEIDGVDSEVVVPGGDPIKFRKTTLLLSKPIPAGITTYYINRTNRTNYYNHVKPTYLSNYTPRETQFLNGQAGRQSEILDMLQDQGLIRGFKNFGNIRYFVDCFKSFIEGGYKRQFGQLLLDLDNCNVFARGIMNEPFIEDLEKSADPLFKDSPGKSFRYDYIATGGNDIYSTKFISKPTVGAEYLFYFGQGQVDTKDNLMIQAAAVSNKFIQKANAWDIVANETGYLDGINGIEDNPMDDDRIPLEKFKWNPIIKLGSGFTIYGNMTAQKGNSALSQIHNSELLAYIKEQLLVLTRGDAFKKGTYNEFLSTEVEVQAFMDNLAKVQAIGENPIVICNTENNNDITAKYKIKLIHVEYTNINSLEKIVFDLTLN